MKFTWVHVLCLAVVGASAQSFHSGFRLNNFNNLNGRCDSRFGIQAPVIETVRMPNFVASAITRQTCDCVKAVIRPQIEEIITIPYVRRFFQTPSNAIIQTFVGAGNIHIPALPSLKLFAEVIPGPVFDTRNGMFSGTAVSIGSSIATPVYGLNGNFKRISNGAFSGNAFGADVKLIRSLSGTVGAGFNSRGGGTVLPRPSVLDGLRNRC